ncbi:MAG: DUF4203 domain-containing protein [Anaerolineae bacterium]|jgi:hypothetical protein|nr:DUF4203 domain-containing protein [Anaerolineae bacterium]
MATDSFFALACAGMIGILFGLVLCFAGYRFFLILLPIWGFFFGFGFGLQTMQALLGDGSLATITSWVVGFVVALVFAVLAYLFYIAAVAIIAGSLGYSIATGLLLAIGMNMNFIVWLIGIVAGVALAVVVLKFNVQKWVIIIATGILGAGVIVGSFMLMFAPKALEAMQNPVKAVLNTSPLLAILMIVVAVIGIIGQFKASSMYTVASYNRWDSAGTGA